jgi:hypothetical protein
LEPNSRLPPPSLIVRTKKSMNILKCIIALAASAYGSLYFLGMGLVGTGGTPLSQSLLLLLGVSLSAGAVIGSLPKTPLRPLLTAASIPAGFLAFLLVSGFREKGDIRALYCLGMPVGIVALIMLPSVARTLLGREQDRSKPTSAGDAASRAAPEK